MGKTRHAAHLRDLLHTPADYPDFIREERNFAALLYAELLHEPGLRAFLALIGENLAQGDARNVGVYFEYAHPRDLWAHIGANRSGSDRDAAHRGAILSLLAPAPRFLDDCDIERFNRYFVGTGLARCSQEHVQMPSRWNQRLFRTWAAAFHGPAGREFAQRACTLKWAFNAKPDIVIHLPDDRAVCVEIKFSSAQSAYVVRDRGQPALAPFRLTQTELQRYVLGDLLGYRTRSVFLSRAKPRQLADDIDFLTWEQVYRKVLKERNDRSPDPLPFARRLWSLLGESQPRRVQFPSPPWKPE